MIKNLHCPQMTQGLPAQSLNLGCYYATPGLKGTTGYKHILATAKSSKGKDEDGYRAEFIRLVEMAELLTEKAN